MVPEPSISGEANNRPVGTHGTIIDCSLALVRSYPEKFAEETSPRGYTLFEKLNIFLHFEPQRVVDPFPLGWSGSSP